MNRSLLLMLIAVAGLAMADRYFHRGINSFQANDPKLRRAMDSFELVLSVVAIAILAIAAYHGNVSRMVFAPITYTAGALIKNGMLYFYEKRRDLLLRIVICLALLFVFIYTI